MRNRNHTKSAPFLRGMILSVIVLACGVMGGSLRADVDFNREIRPILSDNCFQCHGPDEDQRQADLRLDTLSGIRGEGVDRSPVIAGKPDDSELYRRLVSENPDQRMPPPSSKRTLTAAQINSIREWIEQGANWQQHWSFVRPESPTLPVVSRAAWARNPIDLFVAARWEGTDRQPLPEADRATLLRRVTLDLTGLPPTSDEVAAFLADRAPAAYERVVDRLLQSPAYGERMAVVWLDAARYADTSGYQNDGPRQMWRWRDWVIAAFNHGLPFDQFTIDQLAGDLLPAPTLEQRLATGFNRNHRGNAEGGIIAEEFQVEYVVDRVETTSTVWLGLTLGCARCHDHKYDPFSQREFYELFAYFNNIPENGRAVKEGNSPPYLSAPTAEQQRALHRLDEQVVAAEQDFAELQAALDDQQLQWERTSRRGGERIEGTIAHGEILHVDFDQPSQLAGRVDRDGELERVEGVQGKAGSFDGQRFVDAGDTGNFGYFDKFSMATWVRPERIEVGTILSRMTDEEEGDGYYVQLRDGRLQVNLVKRWLDDCVRVETEQRLPLAEWTHVTVTYDGSRRAQGITVYLDGSSVPLKVNYDFLNQTFATREPLRIGGGGGAQGRFQGQLDELHLFARCLTAEEVAIVSVRESIDQLLDMNAENRSARQRSKLRAYFLAHQASSVLRDTHERLLALREQREALMQSFPTVMVMEEAVPRRSTFVLQRGEYDKPLEQVEAGVPRLLVSSPEVRPADRLGLARWLVDPDHPLTARVAVNRYWQMHFGSGLVKTPEDFGTQGEPPSHPELLDWLAVQFLRDGWDVKAMQRLIVTSATYRQSSQATEEQHAADPENRLLARGPRFRLSAEAVRDQALAVAGLLTEQLGGPSVMPYQPSALWNDIATDNNYEQVHGASLYRRSLYTYWKRTVTPPTMSVFDSSSREMCRVSSLRTNTPVQALALMNDVTFVEAARVLAQRTLANSSDDDTRLPQLFQAILCRSPTAREQEILRRGLADHLQRFGSDTAAARRLIEAGEYALPPNVDATQLAAYTMLASMLLNLDEAVTKQ